MRKQIGIGINSGVSLQAKPNIIPGRPPRPCQPIAIVGRLSVYRGDNAASHVIEPYFARV